MPRMQLFNCKNCGDNLKPKNAKDLHNVKCSSCGTMTVYDPLDHRREIVHRHVHKQEVCHYDNYRAHNAMVAETTDNYGSIVAGVFIILGVLVISFCCVMDSCVA